LANLTGNENEGGENLKPINETKDLWVERLEDREEYIIPAGIAEGSAGDDLGPNGCINACCWECCNASRYKFYEVWGNQYI
jgi:hypothetical protein